MYFDILLIVLVYCCELIRKHTNINIEKYSKNEDRKKIFLHKLVVNFSDK